ncbi:alpha-E domain-containing protein [Roseospira marina]|uniref:Alpha-E domain-containing protein n=1 Tax=Roseospira marina TaxID=140057 RepID=A0A5M6ICD8_9PROT|nr:alpha-E domain-containing protein [Roseospira marina]KAA5605944.1 alpha-E domain-containing protein [Roseospira marina]MBB4313210.1 putative alpha-E superfamily protein [Roseospira marina]MBB5086049.1 putative alpha-E superfamily protein [Roseospira marina]
MLSRTAENLYWMARLVERSENMARILDVSHRMSQLPGGEDASREWLPALVISGQHEDYERKYAGINAGHVIAYMALDPDNPSSIHSIVRAARENARAERNVLPNEVFESINTTWLEMQDIQYSRLVEWGYREFFDWVKLRSQVFSGVVGGTMLTTDAYYFTKLGMMIERADNTARLLDVKYHVLVPDEDKADEAVDYYQWGALLRALSAFKAYRMIYRDSIKPRQVVDLLVLRREFPRALHACYAQMVPILETLRAEAECTRMAGQMYARLRYDRPQDVTRRGLHRFLTDFVTRNGQISNEIARAFLFVPAD